MEFPNLNDTKYPNLNNIDVWKYNNTFDYSRWDENTIIRLCNVLWNSNYEDVVKFNSNEERNNYFDSIDGESFTFKTMFRCDNGEMKLPIPYDVLSKYNYIYVISPLMTSFNNKLMYENENFRLDRRFYFINDIEYLSPSATKIMLQPDIWTTWINECDINYFYLARGHAPVAAVDTDTYFNNPIENCEYLLADDISIDFPNKVSHSEMYPINAGKPYLCFASSISYNYISSFSALNGNSDWSQPEYYNLNTRWGYQQGVRNYNWGNTGISGIVDTQFSDVRNNFISNTVYGIPLENSVAIMKKIEQKYPFFIKSIQAAFILGADIINIGKEVSFKDGTKLFVIEPRNNKFKIKFTKEMFNIPKKYQKYTKLYTSQYVNIEISDNNKNSANIKIENTSGEISANVFSNIAYPLLNVSVLFDGVNGVDKVSYIWQDVKKDITYGDISNYLFKFGIPTYAIWQQSYSNWVTSNAYLNTGKRNKAIVDYQNDVGLHNNNCENTKDFEATRADNTYRSTSADVANVSNSMSNHVRNVGNAGLNLVTNQNVANAANLTIATENNGLAAISTVYNTLKATEDIKDDNSRIISISAAENEYTSQTATINSTSSVAQHAVSGTAQFAGGMASMAGVTGVGGMAGGLATVINGGIEAAAIEASADVTISTNSAITTATINANTSKYGNATRNANNVTDITCKTNTKNTKTTNDSMLTQTTNTKNMNNTNAANDQITNNTNASNTKNATDTNASNTKTTNSSNAIYSRNENIEEAKRTLESARLNSYYQQQQAVMTEPIRIGNQSVIDNGVETATYSYMKINGVQLRIKTPPSGKLKQVGDYFARFGYNLEQIWEITNLQVMKYFTYWRARDVWINVGSGTNNIAQTIISNIFINGVTIWSNPNKIGVVNIYDN